MYCPYCGHPNADESRECVACGSSLAEDAPSSRPAAVVSPAALWGESSPLLGRDAELSALRAVLSESLRGRQVRAATLLGAVGLGKSRVVAEFTAEAQRHNPELRVLTGRCNEGAQAVYQPFSEILRERFGLADLDDLDASRRSLFAGAAELFPEDKALDLAKLLGHLLGLPAAPELSGTSLPSTPERLLVRAHSALKRFLEADAAQKPLVLVLEDLHLASKETADLLFYLASTLGPVPICFVLTAEPSLLGSYPDWGKGDFAHKLVELRALPDAHIAELLRSLLSRAEALPEELVAVACERARGNPLSLTELVWTFVDAGVIEVRADQWRVHLDRLGALEIPQSVEEVLEARVRRLSGEERAILSQAAIVGQPFWRDAVLCLWRETTVSPHPKRVFASDEVEQALDALLEGLVKKDFIFKSSISTFPGQVEYRFRHQLLRDLLRASLPPEESRRQHRRAGQWLELIAGEWRREHLEAIGEHRERAGETERAAVAYAKAGDAARERYAMRAACVLYQRALQILPEDEFAFRLEILHNLGGSLAHLGDNESAIGVFEQMLGCAFVLTNRAKAGVALNKIGRAERDRGKYRESIDALNRALSLFRAVGDTRGVASALDMIGSVHLRVGNNDAALRNISDSLALRRSLGDKRSIALSLSDLGNVEHNLGRLAESEHHHRESLELRREIGDREGLSSSLNNLALVAFDLGDSARSITLLEEALALSQEIGQPGLEALVRANLGDVLCDAGDLDGAEGHLTAGLAILREVRDLRCEVETERNLAGVLLARGDVASARPHAEQAFSSARVLGSKPSLALALRTLAEVNAKEPPTSALHSAAEVEAREQFERALSMFDEMGNSLEKARSLFAYAEFLSSRDQNDKAGALYAEARDLFATLGMQGALRRTERAISLR
jgi:tetratricopeptide (TPR) repeat protein